jgi:hypothetical protein
MYRHVRCLFAVAALSLFGATSSAAARDYYDEDIDPTRIYGGLWLGFGGDAEVDGDGEFSGDLETTVGGQFGVDRIVSRYFSLGGEARFGRARWKQYDGTKLIDLDFKPRLRLPLRSSPVEFYAAVPVGLTIPRLRDNAPGPDGPVGWNVGAGGGINFFITDDFGLNAEPMWIMHDFGDYRLKQFSLFLNLVLAL